MVGWALETLAKVSFEKTNSKGHKTLEDAVWVRPENYLEGMEEGDNKTLPFADLERYGYYSGWNNLNHLAKTAEKMSPGFLNLWKWVKKTYPMQMRVSCPPVTHDFTPKDLDNFLRTDLLSLLTILVLNLQGELTKWTDGLKRNDGFCYCTPYATMNQDPEVN